MSASPDARPDQIGQAFSPALAMVGVNLMVLMATLDMSIVNIALPTFTRELGTDFATVQWIMLSYILVIAGCLLSVSRLGDMKGKKVIFSSGLVVFTVASLLCGLAPDAPWLIAFRALQGVGAAMSQALGIAIVTEIAPPGTRGRAIGFIGGTVSLGLMLGPSVGGMLIGTVGWRAIFLINVPIGILAYFMVRRYMPALPPVRAGQRFDIPGALASLVALVTYSLGMTLGQKFGFETTGPIVLLSTAVASFLAFVAIELKAREPMIDLGLFKNALFSLNLIMAVLVFISGAGGFIMPFYLQYAQGYPVDKVGLFMIIIPASMGLTAPFAGALSDRINPRLISFVGILVMIGGCLAISTIAPDTPWWGFLLRAAPFGLGIGIFQAPNNSSIMGAAPKDRLGVVSGLLNYSRVFGQSSGLPLVGAVFTSVISGLTHLPSRTEFAGVDPAILTKGVAGAYRFLALFLVLAVCLSVVSLFMDRRRAVPTSTP